MMQAWLFDSSFTYTSPAMVRALLQDLLGLSEKQVCDILLLRKLYLNKRGLLAAQRDAVADEMKASSKSLPNPDNLAKLSDMSARLQKIAAEDYGAYVKIACAFRRGVRPTV